MRQVNSASEVAADHRPTVLLLDAVARSHFTPHALLALRDAGVAVLALGANGEEDVPHDLPAEALAGFVRGPIGGRQLLVGLRSALLVAAARQDTLRAKAETAARTSEITELTDIGIQLTTEKDYNKLLDLILNQARRITQSDAGSLYVVETDDRGEKRLRFKLSQNDSRPDIPFVEFTMSVSQIATTSMPLSFRSTGKCATWVIAPAPMTPTLTGSAILDLRELEKAQYIRSSEVPGKYATRIWRKSWPARARPTAPH